jgi:antitoxin (DNA-binding transcriptional repressor) of toxin-antitoxin stability system
LGFEGVETVGHVELRDRLSEMVSKASKGRTLAVTKHNRVEAYLVAPEKLGKLAEAEEELNRMRSALPVLIAAVGSRVAFPAESLRSLIGSDLSLDWSRMNAFQAAFPVETSHGEDGYPLPAFAGGLHHEPVLELDDELPYA